MGKFGWRSGYLHAQNLQAGTNTISATTSSISLSEAMKGTPSVVVTPFKDSRVWVSGRNTQEFEISKTGNASSVQFSWMAFDDSE